MNDKYINFVFHLVRENSIKLYNYISTNEVNFDDKSFLMSAETLFNNSRQIYRSDTSDKRSVRMKRRRLLRLIDSLNLHKASRGGPAGHLSRSRKVFRMLFPRVIILIFQNDT